MTDNVLTTSNQPDAQMMESVLLGGDLSKLNPAQRVSYYQRVCESVGLNPLTKPFGYITLNGKLVLYALKDAAEQLRATRKVSITQLEKQFQDDLYIVTAHAQTPDGRTDASTGAVTIGGLKGDAKANALMKAETKAKRRVTLSICGMGFLDESEISSIPDARPVIVTEDGELRGEQDSQNSDDEQPAIELIKPLDARFVEQAAKVWNISTSDAAKEIARAKLSPMTREEFASWLASKS
jgi:hypothetical protein